MPPPHSTNPSWPEIVTALLAVSAAAQVLANESTAQASKPIPATQTVSSAPSYTLKAESKWMLNLPEGERFDASALCFDTDGSLLTVNDKSPGLFRITTRSDGQADLIRQTNWFTAQQLAPFVESKKFHWDLEGVSRDSEGRLYFCEEMNRWVFRAHPRLGTLERLPIDWSPAKKWFSKDLNASWEGIAAGTDGRLYLANERSIGRIVVVDLKSLLVVDDFQVSPLGHPARDIHYSDLCWYGADLWVLCRESHRVLRVAPANHQVLADFDYSALELDPVNGYAAFLPVGQFEGLAVDATNIWLVVDNNGTSRLMDRQDTRPSLYRCRRPDR